MKKGIAFMLTILLVLSGAAAAFAADAMQFTGDEVKMTLEDAQKMMLTSSTAIEAAKYHQKTNKAKARGYYENAINLSELQSMANEASAQGPASPGYWAVTAPSKTQRELVALAENFTEKQAPRDYDAEINQITRNTVELYYGFLQAKEGVRISNENVAIQKKLYDNTQSKFKLGVVSKQDVLKAELGYNEAVVKAEQAANGYAAARMGFNLLIGFDLMQNVTLTDTLTEKEMSAVPLDEAIQKSLVNRNEITGAAFALKTAELTFKEASKYPKSSAQYIDADANLYSAQNAAKNAPKGIEMDVRNKYLAMTQKKAELELGKLNVANAKETYRLANLSYDAGMSTLTDTQQAQLLSFSTELSYFATMLEYNLAVMDYEQAMTVGTTTILSASGGGMPSGEQGQ